MNSPHSGRFVQFDENQLHPLIKEERRQTTRELAQKMVSSNVIVARHLHSMAKVQKHGSWVPHALTERNKLHRFFIAASLLARLQDTRGYEERARSGCFDIITIFS